MTNVTMKALDQLHISSVSQHNLQPGEEFEVSKAMSEDLVKRGLAEITGEVEDEPQAPDLKAASKPANKAVKPLANKQN